MRLSGVVCSQVGLARGDIGNPGSGDCFCTGKTMTGLAEVNQPFQASQIESVLPQFVHEPPIARGKLPQETAAR